MDISIETATIDDAEFAAWTVLTALDMSTEDMAAVVKCCEDDNTIYSWRNALIAKADGKIIGCLIAYDGAVYSSQREYTWKMLWNDFDPDYVKNIEIETSSGEYYLDSMAILPEYRGHDIGKSLMFEAIKQGRLHGLRQFGLIVDVNKPKLYDYYQSVGFEKVGTIEFFGHLYDKLQLNL
jgi:ribosomal protein S18 acetylase RimI-like enzyme